MSSYRRVFVPGGTYFFTVVTAGRRPWLAHDAARDVFREAWLRVGRELPFETVAAVVLPDHVHCIWTLPDGDVGYPNRWRRIKRLTTNALVANGEIGPFWQPRFWEHMIRDAEDLERHVDYVHYNPVRHGLVQHARDWPASSIHRYIREGICRPDWAAADDSLIDRGEFGEPS